MVRLSRQQRREQLLELGVEMITETSFDQFSVDELAQRAGISRSLLFHYFDSRQDFLVAAASRGARDLLDAIRPDPDQPPPVQLLEGITSYLDYVEAHTSQYLALVRGAVGGDAAMRELVEGTRDQIARWLIEGMAEVSAAPVPSLGVLAARAQLALAEEVTVGWLGTPADERPSRDELTLFLATITVDLLVRAGVVVDPSLLAMLEGMTAAAVRDDLA